MLTGILGGPGTKAEQALTRTGHRDCTTGSSSSSSSLGGLASAGRLRARDSYRPCPRDPMALVCLSMMINYPMPIVMPFS